MVNEINLARIDLNLLVLFEAVLAERHVGRAAGRLYLSASAVSHGIRRLRQTFNDPLFLKHPKGVVPTARALAMADDVAQILAQVRRVVGAAEPFEPSTSKRRFVIGAPDALSVVSLPAVLPEIARLAPHVSIGVQHMQPQELVPALDARQIDIALYPLKELPARFEARYLFDDEFIVAARRGLLPSRRLTTAKYCAQRHVLVSLQGEPRGFVDDILAAHGYSRTVALTVPNFLFALSVVASTDMVTTLPRRLVEHYASRFDVVALDPPMTFDEFAVRAVAPKAAMMDAAIVWLLDVLQRTAGKPKTTRQSRRRAPAKTTDGRQP